MSDLLQRLKAGTANVKRIKWPGSEAEVAIRVANSNDELAASTATDKYFKAEGIDVNAQNLEVYLSERNTQLLYRCIADPETGEALGTITEFRGLLTQGVRDVLVDEFAAWQKECSPNPDNTPPEEYDRLVAMVKKNVEVIDTKVSSISLARRLLRSLVERPATSPTGSGST
jgi:hypothetical protein